ncbi:MAG: hypothetical protein ACI3VB_01270 [Oscillospiraceae bacterium]
MEKNFEARFFLGSNSPTGFFSLYDGFTDPETDMLYIIKGGPGSGKSTFMRTIAEKVHNAGQPVEYIHCSGDPDSLDGVYFPTMNTGYVDGTAPHVIEPKYAGVSETYVNIGAFYDTDALSQKKEEIIRLTRGYKAYYTRAYKLISSAAGLPSVTGAVSEDSLIVAARRARGIIFREIKDSGRISGKTKRRFLSAVTCKGIIALYDTIPELAERVYVLDNDLGLAHFVVEAVASASEEQGWDVIRCQSPLFPDITEHLIIPELELAFVSQTSKLPYKGQSYRHLRLDAIPEKGHLAAIKSETRSMAKLSDTLISEAVSALANAKAIHDRLEQAYNPYVDFDGVIRLASEHAERLLG